MTGTIVDALKELCAAIAGGEIVACDVKGDTTAEVIGRITRAYKGESIFDGDLAELTLTSAAGTEAGYTTITVEGAVAESPNYRYKVTNKLPEYGADLSDWTTWDGTSDIQAEDSSTLAICEVDERKLAIAGGTVFVTSNLGA